MTITSTGSPAVPPAPPTAAVPDRPRVAIAARTLRTDRWWAPPLGVGLVLAFFVVYSLVRIFMNRWYWVGDYHYLTPMYSPCLSDGCVPGSSHLGTPLPKLPVGIPLAVLIFPILALFRGTCYYYRKSGYRSFWFAPAACAVPEPHRKYTGESRFPLIFTNAHRYFFAAAFILLLINTYDAAMAFRGADGGFGVGLGTLIILVNVVMLWAYSLSCHAARHILGGRLKHFSRHPVRYRLWTFVSRINPRHGTFAMTSLATVILTDAYIMAVSAGWISDLRLFN